MRSTSNSMQRANADQSGTPPPAVASDQTRAVGFNKREFGKLMSSRFGVTQEKGMLFFDEIGQRMAESLAAGETVFLFGQGTLKVVKKRGASSADVRIRFRPTTRTEKATTVAIEGLPGIAAGLIDDVVPINSFSAGERALEAGRACTAEGPGGKLVVYRDDVGQYRCVLMTAGAAPDEAIVPTKKAAKDWLRQAFALTRG
jgi:nucleoid DNA-binding protein